ncbi:hypothetical protein ARMGADRAFT_1036603 [Armillaria gallica]|uniref:Uncharacterized protein n=1 Tax=Armillaria gallica TaxID=47427 RepID=A0A2H3D7R5_ARMGA|nr:hypothetical protein ARMGADRAFT_1036603 [Armillaria gallica]
MIDMGLITDEDGLLQKVFDPQFRHYYPCPLQLHSEKSPEPSFPAFTVVKDKKKKKKRRMSEAAKKAVKHVSEDEQADDEQVESDLIDQLEPSPLHPSKAASSGGQVWYVDMNTLATYLQPEIKSILDSIHPFLVAHESYFPKDSDPIVICFLATATALANNLSPAFQSSQWDAWKIEDSTRMFLGLLKPRFDPLDSFPGKAYAPSLLSLPFKQNRFQVSIGNISKVQPPMLGLRTLLLQLRIYPVPSYLLLSMVSSSFCPEDLPLPFTWKDLPSLLQADHYLFLHLACTWYPQVLNFDMLVNWCQLDMANLINHVHPFLVAHVEHFPDDEDPLASQFLMTVTAVANNLGLCFFNPDWTLWLDQDCRHLVISFQNFKTLFPGDLHFPGSQHLVIQSDSSPSSKTTLYTSNLLFFQLSWAGVYPIHLPAQLFSNVYTWLDMDIPAT